MTAHRTKDISISHTDLRHQAVPISTGRCNRITLIGPPRGTIWAQLMDYEAIAPLADVTYTIECQREELTGTTDAEGILRHHDIVLGYYTLNTGEDQTTVFSEIEPEEPAIVRMPFTKVPDESYFAMMSDDRHFQIGISDDDELNIPAFIRKKMM